MKPNQKQTWNKIAPKWAKYRQTPSPAAIDFLQNKSGKILDLGCGSGRNFLKSFKDKPDTTIYGIDFSQKMINYAKQRADKLKIKIELKQADSTSLPYQDNFFDSAICTALLHCIEGKQKRIKTIKEIFRTLKSQSQAFISVWGRKSPRIKNKPKECYVPWKAGEKQLRYTYIYDNEELEKELTRAGFKIIRAWEERNINFIVEKR